MRERWDEAINKLDEKYINEAAQTLAKHAHKQAEQERFDAEASRPSEAVSLPQTKKSRKGLFIGIGAAAAVALAVGIGVKLGGKGDDLLPQVTPTVEVTSETSETEETTEVKVPVEPEVKDGAISFEKTYKEGRLIFSKLQQRYSTGADVSVASPVTDMTEDEIFTYIESFSGMAVDQANSNLNQSGFYLDKEKSHWNATWNSTSMPSGAGIGQQMTLHYSNTVADIRINIGENDSNFGYVRTAKGNQYVPTGETRNSNLRWMYGESLDSRLQISTGEKADISIGGLVEDGVAVYGAQFLWSNDDYSGICIISAYGCELTDITDILAGLICSTDKLHEVDVQPFDVTDYSEFGVTQALLCNPSDDESISALADILADASGEPFFDDYGTLAGGEDAQLRCYQYDREDAPDYCDIIAPYWSADRFYYGITSYDTECTAYFELPADSYEQLMSWFMLYTPYSFIGTVVEQDGENKTDPDNGYYLIEDNSGGMYMIHSDERFEIGDSVEVCYYGSVMESYPMQVRDIWVKRAYNMEKDDALLIPDNMRDMGFDTEVFEQYFRNVWNCDNGSWSVNISYSEPECADRPVCFEYEDGWYLGFYNEVAAEVMFIPREHPDTLFAYHVDDFYNVDDEDFDESLDYSPRRNKDYTRYFVDDDDTVDVVPEAGTVVNQMGIAWIEQRLGGNSDEIMDTIFADFTDEDGAAWKYHVTNLIIDLPLVKSITDSSVQLVVSYATQESYDDYWNNGTDESVIQWQHFLCTMELVDGEYALTSRVKCNESGVVPYAIDKDNTSAVDVNITDIDFEVYEQYFMGKWMSAYGTVMTFDYTSGYFEDCVCGATENGVEFRCKTGDQMNIHFIPYDDPNTLYTYSVEGGEVPLRKEYGTVYRRVGAVSGDVSGYMNYMGRRKLGFMLMKDFDEVLDGLMENGFTDSDGVHWMLSEQHYASSVKPYLIGARTGTIEWSATLCMPYTNDSGEERYFRQRIDRTGENYDRYEVFYSVPCDEKGEIELYYTDEYAKYDIAFLDDKRFMLRWMVSEHTSSVLEAEILLLNNDTNEVLIRRNVTNPEMMEGTGGIAKAFALRQLDLKDGTIIAVKYGFTSTLYMYDEEKNEFRYTFPEMKYENEFAVTDGTNIVSWIDSERGLISKELDFATFTWSDVDMLVAADMTITPDHSKADPYDLGTGLSYFMGEWQSSTDSLDLDMFNTEIFSYSDPCLGFYKDDSGYYMLGETRVWFVPEDNRQQMYYFDNVTDGAPLKLSDGVQYIQMRALDGFIHGEGELGYFGLVNFCHNDGDPIAIDALFDIEFTDENGTRWVRTPDRSVDWGGIYDASVDRDHVQFLKMMNADDPSDMRWFSFEFTIGADKTLSWSDEHYSFDMSVFSTEELTTEFSAQSKASSDRRGHGEFNVSVSFYIVPESGCVYALRSMGNNMSQWTSEFELFCYRNGAYELLSDEYSALNVYAAKSLYVLHDSDDGIALDVYDGVELTQSILVIEGDYTLHIGAGSEMFGVYPELYLVVDYHKDGTQYATIYDLSEGAELIGTYDYAKITRKDWQSEDYYTGFSVQNDDGTVTVYGEM